ncbi:MAG: tetratricopeptide repeat protein [Candidatus Thiodiazotropha sp.]
MSSTNPQRLAILCLTLLISGCGGLPSRDNTATAQSGKVVDSALRRSYDAALLSLRAGKLNQARQAFQQLADENPGLSGPMTNIGIILLKQDDPVAAEKALLNALARNPVSVPAHTQLGVALRKQGRFQEAEQAYQTALKLEPVYLLAHRNLGILYDLYLAKPEKALEQYRLCQKLAEAPDKEIEGWILDLERRVGAAK